MKPLLTFFIIISFSNTYAQNGWILQKEIEKAMTYEVTMDTSKITGWVIGCIDGDSTWTFSYGQLSKALNTAPDDNTLFEIGGMTKTFTASVIHSLTEKKVLNYETTVNTYLKPEQQFPLGNKITLLQLTTHTSGLPKLPEGFGANEFSQDQPYLTYTEGELFEFLKTADTADFKVGKYLYSHINHAILEVIIKNTGNYSALTQLEHRLDDSTYTHAQGYNPGLRPVPYWRFGETFRFSLGMKATMNDILDFLKVQMSLKNKNQDASLAETLKPLFKTDIDKYTSVGKLWHILKINKSVNICLQSGATNGQSAFVACVPETKTAVVILANTRLVQGKLGMIILKMLNFNWKR